MQNPALPVEGPLHGITVLDLSSVILGPMAGQYLVLPHPGMFPSRDPIASPECSRSTTAASSANTL